MQFFVHVLAAAFTAILIVCVALWLNVIVRFPTTRVRALLRETSFPVMKLVIIVLPLTVLGLMFLTNSPHRSWSSPEVQDAWSTFPKHVFASSVGRSGEQVLLCMSMLFYMVIGILSMGVSEWMTARGGIAVGIIALFTGYLFVPDYFFGGGEVKMRFAWAVFMFGCLTAASTSRMGHLRPVVAIYVTCCLGVTLSHAMEHNVRRVSSAVGQYVTFLDKLPPGTTFIRLKCSLKNARMRFGFDELALEPLWHVDALVAAKRHMIDLSDYQAATGDFPITYRSVISDAKRWEIIDLEGTGPNGQKSLLSLVDDPPVPIRCTIILGDGISENGDDTMRMLLQRKGKLSPIAMDESEAAFVRGVCSQMGR